MHQEQLIAVSEDPIQEPLPAHAVQVEHAVIIAAGHGLRFGKITLLRPKPLLEVLGLPLIERAIRTARKIGIWNFTVITGHHAAMLESFLGQKRFADVKIHCVRNDRWQRSNGLSVLTAQGAVQEPFLLLMSDHLFEADILRKLLAKPLATGHCRLAVDFRVGNIFDLEDATKVQVAEGRVERIGKELDAYNAIDCGVFLCDRSLFDALESAVGKGNESLTDGIRELASEQRMEAEDIGDSFWQDVDNKRDLEEGERRLLNTLTSRTDSWITRHVNRKISLLVTRRLAATHITPNQITLFNFGLGLTAAACMVNGGYFAVLLGALLFLLSSILDGCDGEIARLKFQQSRLGAWLDVVTDNITHLALFGGITVGLMRHTGSPWYVVPGGLLVLGALFSFLLSVKGHKRLGQNCGPIFSESRLQDVTGTAKSTRLARMLDRAANRDFAYLLVFLAGIDHIDWFLWIAGLGAPIFGILLYRALQRSERSGS
jgi:1L-myo-inositol 1-phosphate cytidylyltransferase / CDP-L-myo-inositol myo-inositolphosphotransferase